MAQPQHRRHVLLQARTVAAVGLISIGGGIGLALMLARTLIWVGLLFALASELAVFWIYWEAFRLLYRTITKRVRYSGPGLKEVLFTNTVAVLMIGICLAVFSIVASEQPPAGRATLEFKGFEFVKQPSSSPTGFLNLRIDNVGNLNAERLDMIVLGHLRPEVIPQSQIEREIIAVQTAIEQLDPIRVEANARSQLRPNMSAVVTLEDMDPLTFAEAIAKKIEPSRKVIEMSDEQWHDFEAGKLVIYVLYSVRYEDDAHPGNYWQATSCLYFAFTKAYWHNCGPSRVDLIRSPRVR